MPIGPVQRYPRGFLELLDIKGVSPPRLMGDEMYGMVDMLQFYGLTQVQRRQTTNAALAEAALLTITVPDNEYWLWYAAEIAGGKTATMTSFEWSLAYGPQAQSVTVAHFGNNLDQFLTPDVGTMVYGHQNPYPVLLLPTWTITARLDVLAPDATAVAALSALVGVLA